MGSDFTSLESFNLASLRVTFLMTRVEPENDVIDVRKICIYQPILLPDEMRSNQLHNERALSCKSIQYYHLRIQTVRNSSVG